MNLPTIIFLLSVAAVTSYSVDIVEAPDAKELTETKNEIGKGFKSSEVVNTIIDYLILDRPVMI